MIDSQLKAFCLFVIAEMEAMGFPSARIIQMRQVAAMQKKAGGEFKVAKELNVMLREGVESDVYEAIRERASRSTGIDADCFNKKDRQKILRALDRGRISSDEEFHILEQAVSSGDVPELVVDEVNALLAGYSADAVKAK
jgi:hypothetical protein